VNYFYEIVPPDKPSHLTLYPISLDTSIRDNHDIVNVNSG
jgi:hypothetical protein